LSAPPDRSTSASLAAMLQARSVAIIGISRPERFGGRLYLNLQQAGYRGKIYGVNPRYESLFEQPCYDSLSALPETPDLALLAVPNERLAAALQDAAIRGVPAAVIFANAAGELNGRPLQETLAETARQAGMAICGPNCMGFLAFNQRLAVSGYPAPGDARPGHIAFITHSGSVFESLIQNNRQVAFNYAISSGNEMVTTLADYMRFVIGDPQTRLVALFLETVRDPETFRTALAEAAERDIPVVALKVGRSRQGARLAQAHSGALAGADAAYQALFDYYGAQRVTSLDEMLDTLELLGTGLRAPTPTASALLDSGGERAMLVDLADQVGVVFTDLHEDTKRKIGAVLEPGLEAANPLDAWGTGNGTEAIYGACLTALDADPGTGITLFNVDLTRMAVLPPTYPQIVLPLLERLTRPLAFMVNVTAGAGEDQMQALRSAGVPVLMGTENGLRAVRHLLDYSAFQRDRRLARDSAQQLPSSPAGLGEIRSALAAARDKIDERLGWQIAGAYGIPLTPNRFTATPAEAQQAAAEFGFPLALKTTGTAHKTEVGGVVLGIRDAEELTRAYRDMAARLGPAVQLQPMQAPGVELIAGLVRDPQFGLMLSIGLGGVWVEVLGDQRLVLLPAQEGSIRRALASLRGAVLLNGARGRQPVDIQSILNILFSLAALARDLGDLIEELDLNPVIARPDGAAVVDVLIVPRSREP